MKKAIVFFALFAAIGGSMQAQDTLWKRPAPQDNYFCNEWIDTNASYGTSEAWLGRYIDLAKR